MYKDPSPMEHIGQWGKGNGICLVGDVLRIIPWDSPSFTIWENMFGTFSKQFKQIQRVMLGKSTPGGGCSGQMGNGSYQVCCQICLLSAAPVAHFKTPIEI